MGILDSLFDKEAMVSNTIENCLENLAEEMKCSKTELFIMIKPTRDEFTDGEEKGDNSSQKNFKNWVYRIVDGKPKIIREISLTEILEA
jgi:hypothetical protein